MKKNYKFPASLWKHKDAKHTEVRYECEVCNARFVSREYLRQHENTHNGPYATSLKTTLQSMSVYLRHF